MISIIFVSGALQNQKQKFNTNTFGFRSVCLRLIVLSIFSTYKNKKIVELQ